jgi:hypothetical protein
LIFAGGEVFEPRHSLNFLRAVSFGANAHLRTSEATRQEHEGKNGKEFIGPVETTQGGS